MCWVGAWRPRYGEMRVIVLVYHRTLRTIHVVCQILLLGVLSDNEGVEFSLRLWLHCLSILVVVKASSFRPSLPYMIIPIRCFTCGKVGGASPPVSTSCMQLIRSLVISGIHT